MAQVPLDGAVSAALKMNAESGLRANLPIRKRKQEVSSVSVDSYSEDPITSNEAKKLKILAESGFFDETTDIAASNGDLKPLKRPPMSKAREIRLEQNRKAARESRRRKKIMVEELQRSVVFFSRANATLKQQNEELQRVLLQAQSQVQAMDNARSAQQQISGNSGNAANANEETMVVAASSIAGGATVNNNINNAQANQISQVQVQQALANAQGQSMQNFTNSYVQNQAHQAAQASATQAMFESQGFPPAAARAAAATFVAPPMASPTTTAPESIETEKPSTNNSATQAPTTIKQEVQQEKISMAPNQFPYFVAFAPGQLFGGNSPQANGVPIVASADGKNSPEQQQQFMYPFMPVQMFPFPFFNQDGNIPVFQGVNGVGNGNTTLALKSNVNVDNTNQITTNTNKVSATANPIEVNQTIENNVATL